MGEGVKALLAKPIELADQVAKQSGSGQCLRPPECKELRARAEKLAEVLRQAARVDLYERPAERIVAGTVQALAKAGAMSARCFESHSQLRCFLTFNPFSGFPRTLAVLDTTIEDVAWLTRISSPDDAPNEPILFLIWDHIACLHTGSLAVRADSASTLASLARDNLRFSKLIVEEDGIAPLVKLLKEGTDDGQEAAATALGLLGRDVVSVQAAVAEAIASHRTTPSGTSSATTPLEPSKSTAGTLSVEAAPGTRYAAPPPPEHMRSFHSLVLALLSVLLLY